MQSITPIVSNCYFLNEGDVNGVGGRPGFSGVTGLTATQMKLRSSFSGFDFSDIWAIDEGQTFPYLQGVGDDRPMTNESLSGMAASLSAKVIDGVLHISSLSTGEQLSVYNLQGQLVYTTRAADSELRIPLSGKGVYIVTAGRKTQKAINN